jgi:hypothetical protein
LKINSKINNKIFNICILFSKIENNDLKTQNISKAEILGPVLRIYHFLAYYHLGHFLIKISYCALAGPNLLYEMGKLKRKRTKTELGRIFFA